MRSIRKIDVERINGQQSIVYLTLDVPDEDILNLVIQDLQKLMKERLPKTYVITGEDIYGKDRFADKVQKLLEKEVYISTSAFYDTVDCYEQESEVSSTIIELNKINLTIFASMLSKSLFTYIFVYFVNNKTTIQDISSNLRNSNNFEDLESALLSSGIILSSRLEGATVVIKCLNKYVDNILKCYG